MKRFLAAMFASLLGVVAHAADWTPCAREGQICRLADEALVRFGTPGRYVFRHARGELECSTATFGGDPAFGQTKQCEVSRNWHDDPDYHAWRRPGTAGGWRSCAVEGGLCQAAPGSQVRFGVEGRFAQRQVSGPARCDVRTFGDPAPGIAKFCEINDGGSHWTPCSQEGGYCSVPGQAIVRYGQGSATVERQVQGGIACNNDSFGDPAPGLAKQCEYRTGGGAPTGRWGDGPLRGTGLDWRPCAREGGHCELGSVGMLRYGAGGRYLYREAQGRVGCSNQEFGGDPAPGETKSCEQLNLAR